MRSNNWTAAIAARRARFWEELADTVDTLEELAEEETYNELRTRAKNAGVSAAGTRYEILARLEAL